MKTSQFKEQLISSINKQIDTATAKCHKDKEDLVILKKLEIETKALFNKIKQTVSKSKIKDRVNLSFYEFSEPTRDIHYIQHDLNFSRSLKSNMKRILKAVKSTNNRNDLNILSEVCKGNFSEDECCFIKLKYLKNIPVLFNSKLNTAYISINGHDIQISEYKIYDCALLDLDKYTIEVLTKLPYEFQVNYLAENLKITSLSNKRLKNFKDMLPKDAKIHDFLNKLTTFS